MDEADRASQIAEDARERALGARLARLSLRQQGSRECVGCGAEIPIGRRLAISGCRTCIDCQEAIEGKVRP